MKGFDSGGSDPRRALGQLPSLGPGDSLGRGVSLGQGGSLGLWLGARATSCFSGPAAGRCHAKPWAAKLVGCSLVTRRSRLGARSCGNLDLQSDCPWNRSEAFPVLP